MFSTGHDINVHLLLGCKVVKQFWQDVEAWITKLGWQDFVVTDNNIIMGVMEHNNKVINIMMLYAKVSIHLATINDKVPIFFSLKNVFKKVYDVEMYKATSH